MSSWIFIYNIKLRVLMMIIAYWEKRRAWNVFYCQFLWLLHHFLTQTLVVKWIRTSAISQERKHVFYDKDMMAHFFLCLPSLSIDIQIFLFTYVNWSILSAKRPGLDVQRKEVKLFAIRNRNIQLFPLHHQSNKDENFLLKRTIFLLIYESPRYTLRKIFILSDKQASLLLTATCYYIKINISWNSRRN